MDRSFILALASLGLLVVFIISVSMWFPAIVQDQESAEYLEIVGDCVYVEDIGGYRACVPKVFNTKPRECYNQVAEDADDIASFTICRNNIVIYYRVGKVKIVQFKDVL